MYVDESGDYNNWDENKTFVMAGVAVHEGQIGKISQSLDQVQQKYFSDLQVQISFHATDIKNGKKAFKDLPSSERGQILTDLYNVFNYFCFPNLVAYATVVSANYVKRDTQVLDLAFEDMMTRFNTFLVRQHRNKHPTKGLTIIDQAHEKKYRELFDGYRVGGTKYGSVNNIVDIPYFAGRRDTRMLQLADILAYGVFQYYEHSKKDYFDVIKERFDRKNKGGSPDGLKHLTNSDCDCYACDWRKHRR
ncbi:DUF3800 domain-containing protein [Caldiplasma sukawensis]